MTARKTAADWTPDHVRRFWDFHSHEPRTQAKYFAAMVGEGIANFLHATGGLNGRVLDYGCGAGDLVGHLLLRDVECYGVDLSPLSVEAVNSKFAHLPNWRHALVIESQRTEFDSGYFDVVTLIETLEHLSAPIASQTLAEIKRILKPGGMLMVTTPNNEDLDHSTVYCPFCDSAFHEWQHMQSYSRDTMSALLADHGFSVAFCRGLDFEQFQTPTRLLPISQVSLETFRRWLGHHHRLLLDRISPRPFPLGRDTQVRLSAGPDRHLCAIANRA